MKFVDFLHRGIMAVLLFGLLFTSPVLAALTDNTKGWAWNENIGWISHNSVDDPSVPTFGVNIDETSGVVTGYAWNDTAQWINFAPTSGYPTIPNNAVTYDPVTRQLSGWAQIVGYGASGWIKFRDTSPVAYGVSIAANGDFTGYAWSDTFGWFEFAPSGYPAVHQDKTINPSVSQWAWNDALGWVAMSYPLFDSNFGVNILPDGRVTGYGWSNNLGWVDYQPAGPYPSAPNNATKYTTATGEVSGWAKVLSMGSDGWIKMRSVAGDTVSFGTSVTLASGLWSGQAWNDAFGWIEYAHPYGSVTTSFTSSGPATPVLIEPLDCVDTYTIKPASPLTPALDWSDYAAYDGTTQAAYQIQVDDDPLFGSTLIDQTVNSTASVYTTALGQLTYNVAYYWRVRVQSSTNTWSSWGTTGTLGTETNCFRTPKHPAPVCNFSMNPASPIVNTDTQFTDTTQLFGGATASQWSWAFGDGQTLSGSNPLVHKNPKHKYLSTGNITIIQAVTDSDGYACSKSLPLTVQVVLPEFEHVIPR